MLKTFATVAMDSFEYVAMDSLKHKLGFIFKCPTRHCTKKMKFSI